MPDEVKRQILRLEVDQAAVKRAISDTDRLNQTVANLRKETLASTRQMGPAETSVVKYGKAAQQAGRHADQLGGAVDKTQKALRSQRREVDANTQSAKEYAQQLRAARDEASTFGDVESRTRALTGAVGFVGGEVGQRVEQTVNVGAEVLASVEAVKLLKIELPEMVSSLNLSSTSIAAMTVATVAVGAAALVAKDTFSELSRNSRDASIAAAGLIQGLRTYYEFQQDATTEDLNARIAAIRTQREANGLLLQDLVKVELAIRQGLDVSDQGALETFAEGTLKVLDAAGLVGTGLDEVTQAISETQAEAKALDTEFNLLIKGWQEGAFAANDATVAAERLAEAERELSYSRYQDALKGVQISIRAEQMTAEQIQARLEQIEIERRYFAGLQSDLEAFTAAGEDFGDAAEQTEQKLSDLELESRLLTQALASVRPEVAALAKLHEDSVASYDDAKKAYAATVAEAEKYAETVAKRQQQLLQTAQKRALQLAQDEQEFNLKRTREVADHYADLAEIDRDFFADRGEIIADALAELNDTEQERADEITALNKDLEDLADDHARSMRRIARDAQRDEVLASRRLDAVALADAQRAKKDAIEDENDQYKDEKDAREDQFRERLELLDRERSETLEAQREALRELEAQHQRERAENQRAFEEEIRRADEDRRVKLAHQQQQFALEDQQQQSQWRLEDTNRQTHFGNISGRTITHYANLEIAANTGLNKVENRFATSMNRLAASATITRSATTRPITITGTGSRQVQAFAGGGVPPINRDVLVGERGPEIARFMLPTRIYPAGARPSPGGGPIQAGAIQININGSTSPQLTARMVRQEVEGILAEYWS